MVFVVFIQIVSQSSSVRDMISLKNTDLREIDAKGTSRTVIKRLYSKSFFTHSLTASSRYFPMSYQPYTLMKALLNLKKDNVPGQRHCLGIFFIAAERMDYFEIRTRFIVKNQMNYIFYFDLLFLILFFAL